MMGFSAIVVLDPIEFSDPPECLTGDRRGTRRGEFVEAPAHVRPAEGKRHTAFVGEHAIAVDLQDPCQMSDRTLRLSVRRIDTGDARRVGSLPRPVLVGIGPQLPGLGLAAPGIEHWGRGFVGEQFWR